MKSVAATILGVLTCLASAYPQAPEDPFLKWMNAIAQDDLRKREQSIAAIRTVAEAEARKSRVRQKMMGILGGLPNYQGPLHAHLTGEIAADGYTIEKVIYESLPGFFVTANVYRPNKRGRYPAVLLQAGHTQEGKAEPQILAANLALKGFVALAFDPTGQGEREQTFDSQLQGPAAGWSVNEHIHAGEQSILAGESVARYFIWDAKRSLDYLTSRPDVDAARLGAAGCSGGGALTTFIGALDARVKAVVPACFPTSYRLLFGGPDPDSEMAWPNFLADELDTADFIELSAPKPWLLQATEEDYFTPAGVKLVYDEAKQWYRLYGGEDKLDFFVGKGPHGTPLASREAVYRWMIRWLKDGRGDYHEQPVRLFTNHELLVTKTGRVQDETGNRKLYQLILDSLTTRRRKGTTAELQDTLRDLKIPSEQGPPTATVLSKESTGELLHEHIRFESEPGIMIEGDCYRQTTSGRKPAVLMLKSALSDSLSEKIAKTGRLVFTITVRDSAGENVRRPYLGNWQTNARASQIGLNLPAMRAHDILRSVDLLWARDDVDRNSIRAAAQGVAGIWLLLAAATDTRIRKIWLDKTPYSLLEAFSRPLNTDLYDVVIPGFLLHWDLDDLVKAMQDRDVIWTDPTNWMRKVVWRGPRFAYRYVLGDMTDRVGQQDFEFAMKLTGDN